METGHINTVEIPIEEYRKLIEDLTNARRDAREAQLKATELQERFVVAMNRTFLAER